jgi:hypothetical protein
MSKNPVRIKKKAKISTSIGRYDRCMSKTCKKKENENESEYTYLLYEETCAKCL